MADFLPTLTIAAKNLANEMTNYNVQESDLQGEQQISGEHIQNNESVRDMLGKRGITPCLENGKTSQATILGENEVGFGSTETNDYYIFLTDIAKYKSDEPNDVIKNWLRNRDTFEFLGLWEKLYNFNFKPVEFDGFKN